MASKLTTRDAASLGILERVGWELMSWPGVTSHPHRFGGIEFRVNGREMGHLHGDWLADLPFPRDVGRKMIQEGRASPHHVLPHSGWISYHIINDNDDKNVHDVIELFRLQYDRMTSYSKNKKKSS